MADPKVLTRSPAAAPIFQGDEGKGNSKEAKILCFGDSLTEGYYNYGMAFSPYSESMKGMMERELNGAGQGWNIEVTTEGMSGESVNTMERRMKGIYKKSEPETKPFSHVIFLGGTNDLGRMRKAPDIFSDIKKILAIPCATGATVIVMTVPECHAKIGPLDDRRNELNSFLKAWAAETPNMYIFDLFEKIKYHDMSREDRDHLWDDGLHLTDAGYEVMGELVGGRMIEVLSAREA